jgi:hypothetical protein
LEAGLHLGVLVILAPDGYFQVGDCIANAAQLTQVVGGVDPLCKGGGPEQSRHLKIAFLFRLSAKMAYFMCA